MNQKVAAFKEELNRVFDDSKHTKKWHKIADWVIIGFIIISTIEVYLTTFNGFAQDHHTLLSVVEWITQIFFTVEVTLRIWCADRLDPKYKGLWGRVKYCFTFYGFIDFVSTYTFFLGLFMPVPYLVLKAFRVARLMRIFRFMHSFRLLVNAFKSKKNELLVSTQFVVIITLILGLVLYFVEHAAQPDVFDNAWYAVAWAFTQYVYDPGYFGVYPPITVTGQVIAFIVGVLAIAMFAVPAGIIGSAFTDIMEDEEHDEKVDENIQRIVHSFKFMKDQQHTQLYYVPRYKTLDSIITKKYITEEDIIEAIEKSDCLHLYDMAEAMNRQDHPVSQKVVVNCYRNTPYGCCINRNSKVTIVSPAGANEPVMSWFAFHVAKLGGFNYISKEVEYDPDNPVSYYYLEDINDCPNLVAFVEDLDKLASRPDSWVIQFLSSEGIQTGPDRRMEDLHFCYSTRKHDHSYDDPNIRIVDKELFERMYVDMEKTMLEEFDWVCDKNDWHTIHPEMSVGRYIKAPNMFTLRVESKIHCFSDDFLSTIQTMAAVFNRHLEPEVEKPIPPEMLHRPSGGHDFGMGDYIEK